ncbi:phosphoribosyltransferase [Streptomyces sp. NPDC051976]|uniref:phosphoribosyltransferase n=1 Tax=Streptomyces sp. NPDC051976 TaxID=3154947 RepID=UPI0034317CCA
MSNLLEAVETAQDNIERLADPGELRAAAEQIMSYARKYEARSILAASPAAERLVGALLSEYHQLVALTTHVAGAQAEVLIVDINLASGMSVAQAARVARTAGAQHVHAVVLHQLTAVAARASDCGVDVLDVLGPVPPERQGSTTSSGLA